MDEGISESEKEEGEGERDEETEIENGGSDPVGSGFIIFSQVGGEDRDESGGESAHDDEVKNGARQAESGEVDANIGDSETVGQKAEFHETEDAGEENGGGDDSGGGKNVGLTTEKEIFNHLRLDYSLV